MFLLGHSCWSYIISRGSGEKLNVRLPVYLALLAGGLPDFDIYFKPLIEHHTYTHSILFLFPLCIILTYKFKRVGAAFSLGILSHLLTDSLVGTIPLLYPVSTVTVGLSLGLPSPSDTILEVGSLGVAMVYALRNGDYEFFRRPHEESLMILITLVSIVTLTLLFAGDNNVSLATFAFSRRALTAISLGHIVLVLALSIGSFQGVRAYLAKHPSSRVSSTKEALQK